MMGGARGSKASAKACVMYLNCLTPTCEWHPYIQPKCYIIVKEPISIKILLQLLVLGVGELECDMCLNYRPNLLY